MNHHHACDSAYLPAPSPLQPREKLQRHGIQGLHDRDLLGLLLGSGTKSHPVSSLSEACLKVLQTHHPALELDHLLALPGIGQAKAGSLLAALELARRFWGDRVRRITQPGEAWQLVRHYHDRRQEHFVVISLNGAHEVISTRVISSGLINKTLVHPREIFAEALKERAVSVILAHNHPSGQLEPSREDRELTARMVQAGRLLGIGLLDHVVFSEDGFFSFQQAGWLS